MKIGRIIAILVFAGVLYSCNQNRIYIDDQILPDAKWAVDNTLKFDVEITDTLSFYDLIVFMRNTKSYPYQNLWLFVTETTPDKTVKKDTLQCFLVDNYGRWIGSGIGSIYYNSVFYKNQKQFSARGIYSYEIRHGMRCSVLNGLQDVGLKIEKKR